MIYLPLFTTLEFNTFISLLTFCYNSSYFNFNNTIYKQNFCAPMGDPLSPVMTNFARNFVVDSVITDSILQFKFIYKYADNLLLTLPTNLVDYTFKKFNKFNPHIQFTQEVENNNS